MQDQGPPAKANPLGWGEALKDAGATIEAQLGPEAAVRFERELFQFQRRRAFGYCLVAGIITLVFFALDLIDSFDTDWTHPEALADLVDPVLDGALALVYTLSAVAIRRYARTREQVLTIFSTLLMVACSGMVVVASLLWAQIFEAQTGRAAWEAMFVAGFTSITIVFIMHFLASLFVALPPREAILPLVPVTITFVVIVCVVIDGPTWMRATLLCAWPLAGGPGVLWSAWRHRRFVDHFRWRTMGGRYRDMRADLREARRVHESLFPAAISDGPVRLAFAYEPMRDIGGDYLFAHRRPDGGLLVILFDVSGHGVASALAASRLHGELDRLAQDRADVGVAEAMRTLNRFVHRSLASQAIFASAVGVEVGPDGAASFVNAGHPSALLRRADGQVDELRSTTTLLGVLDPTLFETESVTIAIERGQALVFSTDGVHEATNDEGTFYGEERFRALVAGVPDPSAIPHRVLAAVQAFRAGEASDDVLVAAMWRIAG